MLAALLAAPARPGQAAAQSVAVGGVAGLAALADPAATVRLRRDGRVRLYIHDYAWTRLPEATRRRILRLFPRGQDVEFGLVRDPARWFGTVWQTQYARPGVHGLAAHVNGLSPATIGRWPAFVAAARANGFSSIAPVMAPNSGQYRHDPFEARRWDYVRDAARLGGGLTVDAPADRFLDQPPGYCRFVLAELAWARSHRLHGSLIVSPGRSGPLFRRRAAAVLDALRRAGTLPDEFVVENYEPAPTPAYPNGVGTERDPASVAAAALDLVRALDR